MFSSFSRVAQRALRCIALLTITAIAAPLSAQQTVGYPPSQSPFRDLETSQRISLFTGYFHAQRDPVAAAPQSAPLLGIRYELTINGPAEFFVRVARTSSKRNAVDPTVPQNARSLGTVSDPILLADLGISTNLTGRKSWHHLVPTVGFGLGVASANRKAPSDPYSFGTQFAFTTDFGIRIVPTNSYDVRFGIANTLYQVRYPASYYVKATDNTSVLGTNVSRSSYVSNWAFTAGLTFPIFR